MVTDLDSELPFTLPFLQATPPSLHAAIPSLYTSRTTTSFFTFCCLVKLKSLYGNDSLYSGLQLSLCIDTIDFGRGPEIFQRRFGLSPNLVAIFLAFQSEVEREETSQNNKTA